MHPAATAHRRAVAARPIGPWLPAALRVPLIDLVHRNTGHRCAEATADLGKDVGVTEVRRRLDDGLCAWCRIVALEDARPDEHRFGAELHGQRRVGRRGDTTRAEQRDRKPTGFGDLLHQRKWGLQLLGPLEELCRIGLADLANVADDVAQVANRLDDVAGTGFTLRPDHARTLADAAQRLAEVGRPT